MRRSISREHVGNMVSTAIDDRLGWSWSVGQPLYRRGCSTSNGTDGLSRLGKPEAEESDDDPRENITLTRTLSFLHNYARYFVISASERLFCPMAQML